MKKVLRLCSANMLLILAVLLISSVSASAIKRTNEWFTAKNGVVYYYGEDGKRVTGKTTINKRTFYFDEKGRQLMGWQKINNDYYFFRINTGKKACMVKSTTVNGIKINDKGKADRSSNTNQRKLRLMVAANKTLESLTGCSQKYSKREKLKMCFTYTEKKFYCCNIGSFRYTSTWDMDYAERVIIPTDRYYRADCYTYGCGMAYLANACGGKANAVSSGGHGWCDVDGYVCDSNWSRVDRANNYFMRSYNAPGGAMVPAYRSNRRYVKPI